MEILLSYSSVVFLPGLPMNMTCPYLFLHLNNQRAKNLFLVLNYLVRAHEKAQQGKALAAKPNNLSSIPVTHKVKEKTDPWKLFFGAIQNNTIWSSLKVLLWNDFLKFTFSFWVFLYSLGFILTREQISTNLEEDMQRKTNQRKSIISHSTTMQRCHTHLSLADSSVS